MEIYHGVLLVSRLKVLVSAYACEPGFGSEPGIGWNIVRGLCEHDDVWVITRASNCPRIEGELARNPVPNLHFIYYDLPRWVRFWKRGARGVQLYYYFWQLGIYRVARDLHRQIGFDLTHHVTLGRYWSPSFLSRLPVPFVWGPIGGGESAPRSFWSDFSWKGKLFETLRSWARWLGEHDPFVRSTARNCAVALATTEETAARLGRLGVPSVEVFCQVSLPSEELVALKEAERPYEETVRFVSIGRLLHWKGVHLGLRAFAQAGLTNAEYWIIGDGPERMHLETLARQLGLQHRVRFLGSIARSAVLAVVRKCHVLVHPSLHDSGGWVCLEAMAASLPVVCLDLGGPATIVADGTGIKVPAITPGQAVDGLAQALRQLGQDSALRRRMGDNAWHAVVTGYRWEPRTELLSQIHHRVVGNRQVKST